MITMKRLLISSLFALVLQGPVRGDAKPLQPWMGRWKGTCQNISPNRSRLPGAIFELERNVIELPGGNRFSWTSTYRSADRADVTKDYELVTKDGALGHYQMDEKNGVLIDTFLAGDTLVSHFEVAEVAITSRERIQGDLLEYELLTFRKSGPVPGAPVASYPLLTNQKCILSRIVL